MIFRYTSLSILLVVFCATLSMAQIERAEYFFDQDPGLGMAIVVTASGGSDVVLDFSPAIDNLSSGFHTLFIRAQDQNDAWSHTVSHLFYLQHSPSFLASAEYYLDIDPGYGNGTAIAINGSTDETQNFVIPLSGVPDGLHLLVIRVKDSEGKWSQSVMHVFNVKENTVDVNIVRIEYYFESEGEVSQWLTYTIPSPSPSVDANFTADVSGLTGDKEYTMYFRAINERGLPSLTYSKKIKVCNDVKPEAKFDFSKPGITQIKFENQSEHATAYQWDFADGTSSTEAEPEHTFTTEGLYNVRLVASNACYSDTLMRRVNARSDGVWEYSPKILMIDDTLTRIEVQGAAFGNSSKVVLRRNSYDDVIPEKIIFRDDFYLDVFFNASEIEQGKYDLIVLKEGTEQFAVANAISVQDKEIIPFGEWVPFSVSEKEKFFSGLNVPANERLFVFIKKATRIGYSSTWTGDMKLFKDDKLVAETRRSYGDDDLDLSVKAAPSGYYTFEITSRGEDQYEGFIKFSLQPDVVPLNQWSEGEVLRPYGSDWKYIDITGTLDTLFIRTQGYGLWSTVRVFYDTLNAKKQWNFGTGYSINAKIVKPANGRYYFRYTDSAVLLGDDNRDNDDVQKRTYLLYVGGFASTQNEFLDKSITKLSTEVVGLGKSTVTIEGVAFHPGDSIYLRKEGGPAIAIKPFAFDVDGRSLNFEYDFSQISPGEWEVKVGSEGNYAISGKPLTVNAVVQENLWVDLVGPDQIRVGRKQRVIVRYGNRGNVDVHGEFLYLVVPHEILDSVYLDQYMNDGYNYSKLNADTTYVLLNFLPAGYQNEFEIILYTDEFEAHPVQVGFVDQVKHVIDTKRVHRGESKPLMTAH